MKIDLISLYPTIVLDNKKWRNGKLVRDGNSYTRLQFGNSDIFSFKRFKRDSSILTTDQRQYVREAYKKVLDGAGNNLSDFTIVSDPDIDVEGIDVPSTDSQQILTYFAHTQGLSRKVDVDVIKILCYKRGGRRIYFNERDEVANWCPQYSYLVPVEQDHKGKVKIHKHHERIFLDVLERMAKEELSKYRRLLTSIALFNESARTSLHNQNSAVVLIVSALESLFQLPKWSKKDTFSYALKILWGFDDRIADWATQLYELRSQIVHGEVTEGEVLMASKDHHYPHLDIANDVYEQCLWFALESYGNVIINSDYKRQQVESLRNKVISNKEKVQSLLNQKAKYTYKAFMSNSDLYRQFLLNLEALTGTDYSARDSIVKLLDVIFSVAEEWMAEYKKNAPKDSNGNLSRPDDLWRETIYVEMRKLFGRIRATKKSLKGQFQLHDDIEKLREHVRTLEPIFHDKSAFRITLTEFLARGLNAVFATF